MDPLQFGYQPNIGVDDALIYMLQRAHAHLDTSGATVRIMFFDFSSAFNAIQPVLLGEKMRRMHVDSALISWVMDYLTCRQPASTEQHGGPTRNCPVAIPVYTVQSGLPIQLRQLLSSEIF